MPGPWSPLSALLDTDGLALHYGRVQAALTPIGRPPVSPRVAASVGHLGLLARVICPAVGAAALGRSLDLGMTWWLPVSGGVLPLAAPPTAIGPSLDLNPLRDIARELVDRTAHFSVSPQVLWGNVSSALNGAAAAILTARPDLADTVRPIVDDLLGELGLTSSHTGAPGGDFRRRSCCLFYLSNPAGRDSCCGDCVLRPTPALATARIN